LADGRPLSDGPNMLRIDDLPALLDELLAIHRVHGCPRA
jgi:3-deoxy-D-manno-octulosonic acid (KDO) 8-phosphate synthase